MTKQPNFDTNSLIKLRERTEYETWFLEAVYTLVEQELFPTLSDGVIYPVDISKTQFFAHMRGNIKLRDWRPGFLNAGSPLVFVTTFKLLDMLIEWILEENGFQSNFRFHEKLKQLKESPIFPSVIESRVWLKERLIGLYSELEPFRGTIIHDKRFTATDGALRVASSKKGVIRVPIEISAAHLRKLAIIIVSVLKYIDGSWDINDFREKTLRHDLDELITLHGLSSLGQKPPFHTCVRVYLTGTDPLLVDLMAIRRDLDEKYVNKDYSFDLRVLMVSDDSVVDAYFFPWSIVAVPSADWSQTVNAQQYKTMIPNDIKPEHLRNNVG